MRLLYENVRFDPFAQFRKHKIYLYFVFSIATETAQVALPISVKYQVSNWDPDNLGHIYLHGLTSILASEHMLNKVWDEIIHLFKNSTL